MKKSRMHNTAVMANSAGKRKANRPGVFLHLLQERNTDEVNK
jgi:hypothetical protein